MKRILLVLSMIVVVMLAGCNYVGQFMLDYETAEEFEQAINDGGDVAGTLVMVEVKEVRPNSAFGYNILAGNHLNFVDAVNPKVEAGDFVVFKVENIASIFGSYILTYEEHTVIKAEDMK